jgi:glycosyltransferase involved in cell wall biosynthesis
MHFLFYLPNYGKNGAATCQMWTELCEHLAEGHQVEVVCSGSDGRSREVHNGVDLRRTGRGVLPSFENRHWREMALWLEFCKASLFTPGQFDFVVCADTPRFVALAAWLRKVRDHCQIIAWTMDLPLEQLARRHEGSGAGGVAKLFNQLQYLALRLCDKVVVLGECMRHQLQKQGLSNVEVLGPWAADPKEIGECTSMAARIKEGLPEKFTVGYYGYAGEWHNFDPILEAIPELTTRFNVQFLFAGLGPGIDRVVAAQKQNGWENINIKGWVPRGELGLLPLCSDLHLVSLKKSMLGTCVPSKTYGALAFGRPVIFIGPKECQAARDLVDAQAGEVVETGLDLVKSISRFFNNPDYLQKCSWNAQNAFHEKHSANALFKKWDEFFQNLGTKPSG